MAQTHSGDFEQSDRSRGRCESEGLPPARPARSLSERAFCDPRRRVGINQGAAIALTRQRGRAAVSGILFDGAKLIRILIVIADVWIFRFVADLGREFRIPGMDVRNFWWQDGVIAIAPDWERPG